MQKVFYKWCLHCETAHTKQQWEENNNWCPQPGCNGSPMDEWPWYEVKKHNPSYPSVSEIGKAYPLYGPLGS
jgi:hypothetical protein